VSISKFFVNLDKFVINNNNLNYIKYVNYILFVIYINNVNHIKYVTYIIEYNTNTAWINSIFYFLSKNVLYRPLND